MMVYKFKNGTIHQESKIFDQVKDLFYSSYRLFDRRPHFLPKFTETFIERKLAYNNKRIKLRTNRKRECDFFKKHILTKIQIDSAKNSLNFFGNFYIRKTFSKQYQRIQKRGHVAILIKENIKKINMDNFPLTNTFRNVFNLTSKNDSYRTKRIVLLKTLGSIIKQ